MLPWQQHFEGHVILKFEFFAYFVDLIGLGSSILVTLSTIVLRYMISKNFQSNCDVIDDVYTN